ncbi:hypothetical protein [Paenibacillus taiwanensis]|uniref:hypothetical protein n=1 Tax=Paenibacillus taiwanensis TaxID=401638 RepID=UPI00041991DD|nr:hypothetical protein [Paenibacillus taiwanensis]
MSGDQNEQKPTPLLLPNSVLDLLISDSFHRNGITPETQQPIAEGHKTQIKAMVEDLSKQVQQFIEAQKQLEEQQKKAEMKPEYVQFMQEQRNKAARAKTSLPMKPTGMKASKPPVREAVDSTKKGKEELKQRLKKHKEQKSEEKKKPKKK